METEQTAPPRLDNGAILRHDRRFVRRLIGDVLWQPIAALNWVVDRLHYRRRVAWLYESNRAPLRLLHRMLVAIWSPFYVRTWEDDARSVPAPGESPRIP